MKRYVLFLGFIFILTHIKAQETINWVLISSKTGGIEVPNNGLQQTSSVVADFDNDGINDFAVSERTVAPGLVWYRRNDNGWKRYIVDDRKVTIEAGHFKSQLPEGYKWKMVWNDEFDGNFLDTTKWSYRLYIMQKRHKTWTNDAAELDGKDHKGAGSGPIKVQPTEDGYHTFGLHWSPTGYVFYADGKETWRISGPVSHREQFILVSTEVNGYRSGAPSPLLKNAVLPDYFIVDYVRVFDEVQ